MTDREKIIRIIERIMFEDMKPYTVAGMADEILTALRPSFSASIVKNNEVHQLCNLGHHHVTYRLNWRREFVPALRILVKNDRMSTADLNRDMDSPTAGKVFSELVHFGLVFVSGTLHGDRLYRPTDLCKAFLDGREGVPESVFPKDRALPPEAKDGPLRLVYELHETVDHRDRAGHVERAVDIT
jgi:hypothetical protein